MASKRDVSKEQNEKFKRILKGLLKKDENRNCADCGSRGPTWASTNLGVFVCLTCSGIHRSLGVHISVVRSTNLDTWLPEQVAFISRMDNVKANSYWEANTPREFRRPRESDQRDLERFIRDKYQHKQYRDRDMPPPTIDNYKDHPLTALDAAAPAAPATAQPAAATSAASRSAALPRPGVALAAAPAAKAPEPPLMDLLSLDDPAPAPAPAPPAPAPAAPAQQTPGNGWASFEGSPAAPSAAAPAAADPFAAMAAGPGAASPAAAAPATNGHQSDPFGASGDPFAAANPALSQPQGGEDLFAGLSTVDSASQAAAPAAKAAPKFSNDDILKMFDAPAPSAFGGSPQPMMQHQQGMGAPQGNVGMFGGMQMAGGPAAPMQMTPQQYAMMQQQQQQQHYAMMRQQQMAAQQQGYGGGYPQQQQQGMTMPQGGYSMPGGQQGMMMPQQGMMMPQQQAAAAPQQQQQQQQWSTFM